MIRISAAGVAALFAGSLALIAPAHAGVMIPGAVKSVSAGPVYDVILARGVGLADRERRALQGKPSARPKATAPVASSKKNRKRKKRSGTIFNFNTGG